MAAKLPCLEGIRAVLFDIYGTLLISASGDIANADTEPSNTPFRQAVTDEHQRLRQNGIEFPEVDIREIWQKIVADQEPQPSQEEIESLAVEYELRVNPVWPMPQLSETIAALRNPFQLGIISNAQFMTPQLFPALAGSSLEQMGFVSRLCFYSFVHRQAKPGRYLYQLAAQRLDEIGIGADETLYVGNDMKKDVWPASQVGFYTALFAGDRRSLRLHDGDKSLVGIEPDLVITELNQLLACIV